MTVSGTLKATYIYNGVEQLAVRSLVNQTPSGTIHAIYDRFGNLIADTDGAGQTVREYIWLPSMRSSERRARARIASRGREAMIASTMHARAGSGRPVAVVNGVATGSPVTYYAHVDHLSRPVRLTDAAKATVWEARWQPFGAVHTITGTVTLNARFPGQWFQLESGLHYNWHRHYDPTIGRYTQADPHGFVDGPSVYGYAGGNPSMLIDLLGLYTEIIQWGRSDNRWGRWGHMSGNFNGSNFSFGPRGWDMTFPSAADYATQQSDVVNRGGRGLILNLTPEREGQLIRCLFARSGAPQTAYSGFFNNCANIWLNCLQQIGVEVDTKNQATLYPMDVYQIISKSPAVIGTTAYPGLNRPHGPSRPPMSFRP